MTVKKELAKKRLSWMPGAQHGVLGALGEDIVDPKFKAFSTVDPLKFILKIQLRRPLQKATREPLRRYLRCWAAREGCELPVIRITDQWVQAEVLTKTRTWSRDAKGKFERGRRFVGRSG